MLTVVPIPRATTRALIALSRPNNARPRTFTTLPEASRTLCTTPARNPAGGLNAGVLPPPMPPLAAAVQDLAEDLQQRRRVGQVVVDQHQRRRGPGRDAQRHRRHQLGGRGQVARPDPQVDQEPADDRQRRVNPDPTQAATAPSRPSGPPFFAGSGLTRPCSSSSWTASGGAASLLQLEPVEVLGAAAGLLEDAVDGAGVDVADVGGRLDRAARPDH